MKKTFTKILSVVLCAVMVLGAAPLGGLVGLELPSLFDFKAEAATFSGTCGDNLNWSLDTETGVLNITGTGAMTNYSSSSSVPWYSYCSDIKTVNIASGVTTIGDYAFSRCENLTSVTIPDSVTSIGSDSFYYCDALTDIYFDGTEGQWNSAFSGQLPSRTKVHFNSVSEEETITKPEEVVPADYSAVEAAKAEAELIDYSRYTSASVASVQAAIAAVEYGLDATRQTEVNAFAKAINMAVAALVPLAACNYSDLDAAIEEYYYLDASDYTPLSWESSGVDYAYVACAALPRDLIADEEGANQALIDNAAATLTAAIAALVHIAYKAELSWLVAIVESEIDEYTDYWRNEIQIPLETANAVIANENASQTQVDEAYWSLYHIWEECITEDGHKANLLEAIYEAEAYVDYSLYTEESIEALLWEISDAYSVYNNDSASEYDIETALRWLENGINGLVRLSMDKNALAEAITMAESIENSGYTSASWAELQDALASAKSVYEDDDAVQEDIDYAEANLLAAISMLKEDESESPEIPSDAIASGTCGENLVWYITPEYELVIDGSGEMCDYYYSNIPWYSYCSEIKKVTIGDSVTTIGYYAFRGCTSLTSVTIPDSVTRIGNYAFDECTSLTSITIPDSVTTIGEHAISGCYRLTSVTIGNSVTNIGQGVFSCCTSLTSITIPDSVKAIGYYAFYSCSSLTSVTIPDSVTTIGDSAFEDCSSLTNVTIGSGVTAIAEDAFACCYRLTSITIDENNKNYSSDSYGVLFNKDKTTIIQYPAGNTRTSYTISDSVTTIGDDAFAWCISLTSVTIPDGVTTIGDYAFDWCDSLTSVTIPDSVTTIGEGAFYDCYSLTDVYYGSTEEDWNKITIGSDNECLTNATIHFTEPTIASGECGENLTWVFDSSTGVLTISGTGKMYDWEGYPSIYENNAPWGDYSSDIRSVIIEDGVRLIGEYAFFYCESLTSITIPDTVESIGSYSFAFCENLTSVTIPNSVTAIGTAAFAGCYELLNVDLSENLTELSVGVFNGCFKLTNVTIPDNVTTIGDYAFANCNFTSIAIPDSVTTIGEMAFVYCDSLTSVTIPDTVTSIGEKAFYGCESLENVYYGGDYIQWNKTLIASGNENLLSAEIHFASVPSYEYCGKCGEKLIWIFDSSTGVLTISGIGEMYNWEGNPATNEFNVPWSSCLSDIKSVIIESGVTSIGDFSFFNCVNMTDISIADTVESIGSFTFAYCENLADITLPKDIATIGYGAFIFCTGFESIEIPQNVTCIDASTFGGCSALTSITIPDSLTTIGEYAFYMCDSLSDVYYGGTEEDWNKISIASDNESLTSANIHYSYVKPSVAPVNGAVVDDVSGTIYGLVAGVDSLDGYTELADGYEWSYDEGQYGFGTGTVATLKNGDENIAEYTVVIFGDIDGNSWYDANDAFIVNMIASGLIPADKLSAAHLRAADCNHDGKVDSADFYLLNQASVLLDNVDQSASQAELSQNAVYISYCSLIDQTAGEENNLVPAPETAPDTVPETAPETSEDETGFDFEAFFRSILDFFKKIFTIIFSF